ncbi:hypothetical protein CTI16_06225 [Prevotella intermedia]|uniref:Uncharacterized protein n=1 Tax=Prevotella intermedia TaxID=28131 RepID=A0AAJ3RK29_PREIN|nr:hypothetical protein CUB95_00345 [Prevotella intermedia]PIK18692.1 hypothetical protein CTI16_06225 [Prevotella intermedia]
MQNLLFCIPKAALLHGKSVCFALQKSRFRSVKSKLPFSVGIIFTKLRHIIQKTKQKRSQPRKVATFYFQYVY